MKPLAEPFLISKDLEEGEDEYPSDVEASTVLSTEKYAANPGFKENTVSQNLHALIRSSQKIHGSTLEESVNREKSNLISRALRSSGLGSSVQSAHHGSGICSFDLVHRQQWKLRKDGITYENTGLYEDRRARWMDIFFDLILAGLSLRCTEVSLKSQREGSGIYSYEKHWAFMIASYANCIAVWAQVTAHRNRYNSENGSISSTLIMTFVIACLAFEVNKMEYCVKSLMCNSSENICYTVFGVNALKFMFFAILSLYTAKVDNLMHKYYFCNAIIMLLTSLGFTALMILVAYGSMEFKFSVLWAVFSLVPLIAPPICSYCVSALRKVYQPLHAHYFLERLGLLIIATLAVLMETCFAHSCDSWGSLCKIGNMTKSSASAYVKQDFKSRKTLAQSVKLLVCLACAVFVKVMVFNVYTPSLLTEQVSKSREYDLRNDVRIFSAFILAVGVASLSNEMNRDASVCDEDRYFFRKSEDINECGDIIIIVAITIFHYTNTMKSKKWTTMKLLLFFMGRGLVCLVGRSVATATLSEPVTLNQLDPIFYVMLLLLCMSIEKYFLDLPLNYGKSGDADVLVKMIKDEYE